MDTNNKQGGKVLASGGFGCVFTPALKCIGNQTRDKNKISKLMTNKHAKEEYNELVYVNSKLKLIPNYKNYFLIDDFTLCKPSKLTKDDLKNYRECGALSKEGIPKKNINSLIEEIGRLKCLNNGLLRVINESIQFDLSLKLGLRVSNCSLNENQPKALRDYLINVF
jgi:hypothetical protein